MLNVMIVDDEPPARARLGQVLRDCSQQVSVQVIGEAEGGIRGLEEADRLRPDVVLLDVNMPDMNGIEVARHLAQRQNPPAVIFVTAYDEHALEAFEVQALDYLMKPVRAERLVAALARAERFRTNEPRIEELAKTIGALRLCTPLNEWSDDTETMLADIASHVAQAVENARLVEQTQRTAQRERTINEINARVRQTVTIDSILETAVKELGKSLTATHVFARVSRPEIPDDGHDRTG